MELTLSNRGANPNICTAMDTTTNPSSAVFIIDAKHTLANTAAFSDIAL